MKKLGEDEEDIVLLLQMSIWARRRECFILGFNVLRKFYPKGAVNIHHKWQQMHYGQSHGGYCHYSIPLTQNSDVVEWQTFCVTSDTFIMPFTDETWHTQTQPMKWIK